MQWHRPCSVSQVGLPLVLLLFVNCGSVLAASTKLCSKFQSSYTSSHLVSTCFSPSIVVTHNHRRHAGPPALSVLTSFVGASNNKFLRGFLHDVANQTIFNSAEVLIATTCAHLGELGAATLGRLHGFAAVHTNVVLVVFHHDPGLYGIWNFLIDEVATGEFVTNANLDDRRRSDAWEYKVRHLAGDPHVSVVATPVYPTRAVLSWEQASSLGVLAATEPWFLGLSHKPLLQVSDLFAVGLSPQAPVVAQNFPHNSPVWRRDMHARVGVFDAAGGPFADFAFWVQACASGEVFHMLREPVEIYYINPESHNRQGAGDYDRRAADHANALYLKFIGSKPKCVDQRILFIHSALHPEKLDTIDAWVIRLASEIASATCERLTVVSINVEARHLSVLMSLFSKFGCQLLADNMGLFSLRSRLANGEVFDKTFLTLRLDKPTHLATLLAESVHSLPLEQHQCLGELIALSSSTDALLGLPAQLEVDSNLWNSGVMVSAMLRQQLLTWNRVAGGHHAASTTCSPKNAHMYQAFQAVLVPSLWDEALLKSVVGNIVQVCRVPPALAFSSVPNPSIDLAGSLCFYCTGTDADLGSLIWLLSGMTGAMLSQLNIYLPAQCSRASALQLCAQHGARCTAALTPSPRCRVLAAPLFALHAGVHVDLAAYLARGVPVVTTPIGYADFQCNPECGGLLLAMSPGEMASVVAALSQDDERYQAASADAAGYVRAWDTHGFVGCLARLVLGRAH